MKLGLIDRPAHREGKTLAYGIVSDHSSSYFGTFFREGRKGDDGRLGSFYSC